MAADAKLRQALGNLQRIAGQLKGSQSTGAAQALADVQNAVQELETALKIR